VLGDVLQMTVALCGGGLAVSLGAAVERGGTTIAASGWRAAMAVETPCWSWAPSPANEASGPATWSSRGPARAP
jgi:hypothetical protein